MAPQRKPDVIQLRHRRQPEGHQQLLLDPASRCSNRSARNLPSPAQLRAELGQHATADGRQPAADDGQARQLERRAQRMHQPCGRKLRVVQVDDQQRFALGGQRQSFEQWIDGVGLERRRQPNGHKPVGAGHSRNVRLWHIGKP